MNPFNILENSDFSSSLLFSIDLSVTCFSHRNLCAIMFPFTLFICSGIFGQVKDRVVIVSNGMNSV